MTASFAENSNKKDDNMQDSIKNKLNALVMRNEDITRELASPGVVNDQKRFRDLMKEQNELAPIVEAFTDYSAQQQNVADSIEMMDGETDPEMKEMLREEMNSSKKSVEELGEKIRVLLLPKDPNDDKNVIFEIRAGAGGDEAALFAAQVYRMYVHYADSRGWKVSTEDVEEIGIGGMKYVTFTVSGKGAYSRLKYESGVHRVQRVPETESGGRIHTSTCTVAVMPEVSDDIDLVIPDGDVRMDITRASGNGGQGVNTTDSAVRLTHIPTGIIIYSQTERSQLQNKAKAWALLRSKLYDLEQRKRHDAEADMRRSQVGTGDRSEKIRTYNFPQGRVTDHRIKLTIYRIDDVMNGDLDEIIDALIAADQAAKLLKMSEMN
jgi:peptide chain release factor 1